MLTKVMKLTLYSLSILFFPIYSFTAPVDEPVLNRDVSAMISSTQSVPEENQIILYLDLFDPKDPSEHPDPAFSKFEDFTQKMTELYPKRPLRKVEVENLTDLQMNLTQQLKETEVISHLVIRGHGGSTQITDIEGRRFVVSAIEVGSSRELLTFTCPLELDESQINQEHLDLTLDQLNVKSNQIFSEIQGRFTENPRVLVTSCFILEGTEKEAHRKAKAIAHVLGLRNGTFYANKTSGMSKPFRLTFSDFLRNLPHYKNPLIKVIGSTTICAVIAGHSNFPKTSRFLMMGGPLMGCGLILFPYFQNFYDLHEYNNSNKGYRAELSDGQVRLVPTDIFEYREDYFLH
jgi:hypothetical protein